MPGGGIHARNGVIQKCTALSNTGGGIFLSEGILSGCLSSGNTIGFQFKRCTVTQCFAWGNKQDGFIISGASSVSNCGATNHGFGVGNTNGAGFHAESGGTTDGTARITHCSAINNKLGFRIESAENVITNNSAFGNTTNNYSIKAGNILGPIVKQATTADITEDSASTPGVLSTTNPFANFAD